MILLMRGFRTRKRIVRRKSRIQRGGDTVSDKMKNRLNFFKEFYTEELNTEVELIVSKSKREEARAHTEKNYPVLPRSGSIPAYTKIDDDIFKTEISNEQAMITFVDCHGSVCDNDSGTNLVPPNTVLCFLSPVGTIDYITNQGDTSILMEFLGNQKTNGLTPEKFRIIVNQRMELNKFLSLESDGRYNCFTNSMWYYPGQIYPDIDLGIFQREINFRKKKSLPFQFSAVDITCENGEIKMERNPDFFASQTLGIDFFLYMKLHKRLETKLSTEINNLDITDKLRIVIMTICRPFYDLEKEKRLNILRREIYYYHLNSEKSSQDSKLDSNPFFSRCYQISNKHVLLQKRKHAIGDSDIIYQFEANKKHSMSGVIPSLMKLKDPQVEGGINITSSQGKLKQNQALFLSLNSVIKIIKFIQTFDQQGELVKKNLLSSFIEHSYRDDRIMNRINGMAEFLCANLHLVYNIDPKIIFDFIEAVDAIVKESTLMPLKKKKRFFFNKTINRYNKNLKKMKNLGSYQVEIISQLDNQIDLDKIRGFMISSSNMEDYASNPINDLILKCSGNYRKPMLDVQVPINLQLSDLSKVNTPEMTFTETSNDIRIVNSYVKTLDLECKGSAGNFKLDLHCQNLENLIITNFQYHIFHLNTGVLSNLTINDCNFYIFIIPSGAPLSLILNGNIKNDFFDYLIKIPQLISLTLDRDFKLNNADDHEIDLNIGRIRNPNLKNIHLRSHFIKFNLDRYSRAKTNLKINLDIPSDKISFSGNFENNNLVKQGLVTFTGMESTT